MRFIFPCFILAVCLALLPACGGGGGETAAPVPKQNDVGPSAAALKNQVPPDKLSEVLAAHLKGLGHMERYVEYPEAVVAFRKVHELAPGWVPGSINLAIALLNTTGAADQKSQGMGGAGAPAAPSHFDEALELLSGVLEREPGNLHAHYCRGIILEYLGRTAEAHKEFIFVTEKDPTDAHAWYKRAGTLPAPETASIEARKTNAAEQIRLLTTALEKNPYLVPALYRLQMAYALAGQSDRQKELLDLWRRLNPKQNAAAPGEPAETVYGEMGKYARIIDWGKPPNVADAAVSPPRLDVPKRLDCPLAEGEQWTRAIDTLGRRDRFGMAIATFDANGDGRADLFIASGITGPKGARDALLINQADGAFVDASAAFGLPSDRGSNGVAAGDFDADGKVDLFLCGKDHGVLLRNLGAKFEDVTEPAGIKADDAAVLTARWLDLDQDGDLDLYLVNFAARSGGDQQAESAVPRGIANAAFRNDGVPTAIAGRPQDNWAPLAVAPSDLKATAGLSIKFTPWPKEGAEALGGGARRHTGVATLDVDSDRDLDLVLIADDAAPIAVLNDRLGRFHSVELKDLKPAQANYNGVLAADFDRDGHTDLAFITLTGRLALWRNRGPSPDAGAAIPFEFYPTDAHDWHLGILNDLDLDGAVDLVGLSRTEENTLVWARNTGKGLSSGPLALGPNSTRPALGLALADLAGDPLADLITFRAGEGPYLARNLGNGHHWLALDFRGRWRSGFDRSRTNPHGLGVKARLQGPALNVFHDHGLIESGLSQSVGPVVLGLGKSTSADLVRLTWPDGVMQCELNQNADQRLELAETNRKTGSCPVLFTFDGERFVCIGDFLGGGGLGYLIAPGVYGEPDRDEAVAIAAEQLRPVDGIYRIAVTEPMDEVAYLDRIELEVVDRPRGVEAAPDERFAPGGNRPTGNLHFWKRRIDPAGATDLDGRDQTETLRRFDRRSVSEFKRLRDWVGYTEEHGIVLDFGDRLSAFGPTDRLVLALSGWVEYPYSQTNYAAATAGVALRPPVLERRRDDGSWETIEPDPGYPAGLPRRTMLELTGKLTGPRCVLRLRTNMECAWDEAFIAVIEPKPQATTTRLAVSRARLGQRGYSREISPDGREPLLYDYDHVDPAPLARLGGKLTRFGDVTRLLNADDDQFCVIGPGDEARIEFDTHALPPLPAGWTRGFVLRAIGYCKDADPFTAASDTIGPLPWRGMGAYPFGPEGERPRDPDYDRYLQSDQTRTVAP